MALYKINISYDGTDFHGYQRQIRQRTVQGEIEIALRRLDWPGTAIVSSGRTDAGVHAEGQVATFNIVWKHSEEDLLNALNQILPEDISIRRISLVESGFHPRFDAIFRKYRYQIYLARARDPLLERYYWRVWPEPDFVLMNKAAKLICGTHDFRFYGRPPKKNGRTDRIVRIAEWRIKENKKAFFQIEANSFLYHMVRRITFIIVSVGWLKVKIEDVEKSLEGEGNLPPGIAPAKGLFLEKIIY